MDDVVRWDLWPKRTHAPSGEVIGYRKTPSGYRSQRIVIPELASLIAVEAIDAWTCDLRDIHGLSNSKDSDFATTDLDLFAEKKCRGLIKSVNLQALNSNLDYSGVGLTKDVSRDRFHSYSWEPGNIFVVNTDGSHHLSAARYLARKLGVKHEVTAPMDRYSLDPTMVDRMIRAYEIYALPYWSFWPEGGISDLLKCQSALNSDPLSASNIDPSGAEQARRCVVFI